MLVYVFPVCKLYIAVNILNLLTYFFNFNFFVSFHVFFFLMLY